MTLPQPVSEVAENLPIPTGLTGRVDLVAGRGDTQRLQDAVESFFEHWDALEVRRKQDGTHVRPYGVAPYYFIYGHYYVAQAIELLRHDHRRDLGRERRPRTTRHQQRRQHRPEFADHAEPDQRSQRSLATETHQENIIGAAVDVVVQKQDSVIAKLGFPDPFHQLVFLAVATAIIWSLESVFDVTALPLSG